MTICAAEGVAGMYHLSPGERLSRAAIDAACGLLAFVVLAVPVGFYWAYSHPDRDLWGIPLLSRSNHVEAWVQIVLLVTILPTSLFASGAIIGRRLHASLVRSWLAMMIAVPLSLALEVALRSPDLMILYLPLVLLFILLLNRHDIYWGSILVASGIVVTLTGLQSLISYERPLTLILYGLVGWAVLPALPAVIDDWEYGQDNDDRTVLQEIGQSRILVTYISATALLGVTGGVLAANVDPPRFDFCSSGVALVQFSGPVRQISGPPEWATLNAGPYDSSYEVAAQEPILFHFATVREGGGMFCSSRPGDHASWALIEPAGTHLLFRFEPDIDTRRIRLLVDRDGDGEADERLKPDGQQRDDGEDWLGPETFAQRESCGDACELIEISTDSGFSSPIALDQRSYYTVLPYDLTIREYRDRIDITEPSEVVFWSFGETGKLGPMGSLSALGGLPPDDVITLTAGDEPSPAIVARPGQELGFEVRVEPEEHAVVRFSDLVSGPGEELKIEVSIVEVGLDQPIKTFRVQSPGREAELPLGTSGKFNLFVRPLGNATGRFNLQAQTVEDRVVDLNPEGPTRLETTVPGEAIYVAFEAEAGELVTLMFTDIRIEGSIVRDWGYVLSSPDGSEISVDHSFLYDPRRRFTSFTAP